MAEFILDTEPDLPAVIQDLVIAGDAGDDGPAGVFFRAYVTALIWADTTWDTDSSEPPDGFDNQSVDLPAEQLVELGSDVADFITANSTDLAAYATSRNAQQPLTGWRDAGSDFALTRNRHGAGFWDRGLDDLGDRLTAAAHAYGPQGITACVHENEIRTSVHG